MKQTFKKWWNQFWGRGTGKWQQCHATNAQERMGATRAHTDRVVARLLDLNGF